MPRAGKGPRLYLRAARRNAAGIITHPAVWIIRDRGRDQSTGCGRADRDGAEKEFAAYLARKHISASAIGRRHPASIPVADVLGLYARDIAPTHTRPHETAARIAQLIAFFGNDLLSNLNGTRCRAYAAQRAGKSAARRELQDLRAAINHHRREGLCSEVVGVWLPPPDRPRDRWLTRSEAAKLILSCWRYREAQKFRATNRFTRRHVARFILIGLYTGTRASLICGAALEPSKVTGWIDLGRGVFYRRPAGARETKKRAPTVPLPAPLLAHLRRWQRQGQSFAVEWNGDPVQDVDRAFRGAVRDCGLAGKVTPHTLRHTAATWQMQAGTDPWEAAGYLGMSVETLLRRYGHHHPQHMEGARDALRRHRGVARAAG
jgi:integrase